MRRSFNYYIQEVASSDDEQYVATCREYPNLREYGNTVVEAYENLKNALDDIMNVQKDMCKTIAKM